MVLFLSCGSKPQDIVETNFYDNLPLVEQENLSLFQNITLDTIKVAYPEGVGESFLSIINDDLYHLDVLRVQVQRINENFTLGELVLTRGDGPNEIKSFESFSSTGSQHLFLSGWTYFIYDKQWQLQSRGVLEFYTDDELGSIATDPKADMIGVYELKYYEQKHFLRDNQLLIKIESSNPLFNFIMNREYYEDARIAGLVDLETGEITQMLGRKSPTYKDFSFIPHHDQHYWDITENDSIFVSFEPDSLIYICDQNLQPVRAFGVAGQNMQQDYYQVNNYDDYASYWFLAQTSTGYYKHLNVFENGKLVFRTYNQGIDNTKVVDYGSNPKRLQVYQDFQLIADVPVPSYFKIIGRIGDYFYADGSAENRNNEEIILYSFKLSELLP